MVAADPGVHHILVRIEVALPEAEAVYLMGAFNNWSTTCTPMAHVGDDRWIAHVPAHDAAGTLHLFVWNPGRRCGQIMPLGIVPTASATGPLARDDLHDERLNDPPASEAAAHPVVRA